jgi:hypothetical protein
MANRISAVMANQKSALVARRWLSDDGVKTEAL